MPPRNGRHRRPEPGRQVYAPGALRIPDEIDVTLNWGPKVGTARLSADGRGVIADISFDGEAGPGAADAILAGTIGGLSFQVDPGLPVEAAVIASSTAPLDRVVDDGTWHIISGDRHRHAERNRDTLTGWREHDHLGGGLPHRHDPGTGAQIPVGCDPAACRHPHGAHATTCRA